MPKGLHRIRKDKQVVMFAKVDSMPKEKGTSSVKSVMADRSLMKDPGTVPSVLLDLTLPLLLLAPLANSASLADMLLDWVTLSVQAVRLVLLPSFGEQENVLFAVLDITSTSRVLPDVWSVRLVLKLLEMAPPSVLPANQELTPTKLVSCQSQTFIHGLQVIQLQVILISVLTKGLVWIPK